MRPHQHMRDAAALIAKAPPFPAPRNVTINLPNVIRFPVERIRQKQR